jgi:hypothetical protein
MAGAGTDGLNFTITTICCFKGNEHTYFLSFPNEEALGQYFAGKKDKLIAVSDGWKGFNPLDLFPPERNMRPYQPGHVQKPYDYRDESLEFDFC